MIKKYFQAKLIPAKSSFKFSSIKQMFVYYKIKSMEISLITGWSELYIRNKLYYQYYIGDNNIYCPIENFV